MYVVKGRYLIACQSISHCIVVDWSAKSGWFIFTGLSVVVFLCMCCLAIPPFSRCVKSLKR